MSAGSIAVANGAGAPPLICGTAALAARAYAGAPLEDLTGWICGREVRSAAELAGLRLDLASALRLGFDGQRADAFQQEALAACRHFRIPPGLPLPDPPPLRLLALMAPGDMMVNTPLEFITAHLNVQLDLLYLTPEHGLPAFVPDHDIAFFAVSEMAADAARLLLPRFHTWPRPALNDPARTLCLTREGVAAGLASLPGVRAMPVALRPRGMLQSEGLGGLPFCTAKSGMLIRPRHSHAGHGLCKLDGDAALRSYLATQTEEWFHLTPFVDYAGTDGLYRKYRVAVIDHRPFLCHMATSSHWMVHYLNAGMTEHGERRAAEAAAMDSFDGGFARRHAVALAAVDRWMALDYYQLDCAETPDGELLVFEADTAAIIHLLDPADTFGYKHPHMRQVFAAFEEMLRARCRPASGAGQQH